MKNLKNTKSGLPERFQIQQDGSTELEFFREVYTHRRFKVDCASDPSLYSAVSGAVKKIRTYLSLCPYPRYYITDPDEQDECIEAMTVNYHNQISSPEDRFEDIELTPLSLRLGKLTSYFYDEVKVLHAVTYKYGYYVTSLLAPVVDGREYLNFYKENNGEVDFDLPKTFLLESCKKGDSFHIHALMRDGTCCFEDKKNGFAYAYINVLDSKGDFKKFVSNLTKQLTLGNFDDFGDKNSANLQICFDLSRIKFDCKRQMAIFKRRVLFQIEFYLNYLCPGSLSKPQIAEIAWEINGIPNEQMGMGSRLIGLALWDSVQEKAQRLGASWPLPGQVLHEAIAEITGIMGWRNAEDRNRVYYRPYLLAHECIAQMKVLKGREHNRKISELFKV